jgi:hypothetical protein
MRKQQPKDSSLDELDEHNQPTEPVLPVVPSSFPPTTPSSNNNFIPAPQPYEHPFPQRGHPPQGYAYLPPAPVASGWGRPAGGMVPVAPTRPQTPPSSVPRRKALPILVGLFFVAVQLLLLARFVLKIMGWPASTAWVGTIYDVSNVFVLPFHLLAQQIALPTAIPMEVFTLLAVPAYWLLSRFLVHLLKAILRSR